MRIARIAESVRGSFSGSGPQKISRRKGPPRFNFLLESDGNPDAWEPGEEEVELLPAALELSLTDVTTPPTGDPRGLALDLQF